MLTLDWPSELEPETRLQERTGDDNVHPQNSIALMDRLVAAGIPFEDALYPREMHGFKPAASKHFYVRMTEFFDRHLRPGQAATGSAGSAGSGPEAGEKR